MCGEVRPVIEDESATRRLDHGTQRVGGAADLVIADIFQAKLKGGDIAAGQRFLQRAQKIHR